MVARPRWKSSAAVVCLHTILFVAVTWVWPHLAQGEVFVAKPSVQLSGDDLFSSSQAHFHSYSVRSGLPDSYVRALVFDHSGMLWVGTQNGCARFDGRRWRRVVFPDARQKYVTALASGADGSMWFGTTAGLYRQSAAGEWKAFTADVPMLSTRIDVLISAGDDIWAGTASGLAQFSGDHWRVFQQEIQNAEVKAILKSRDGDLWVGTNKGLFHLRNGVFVQEGVAGGLPDPRIASLFEHDNTIWIGTELGMAGVRDGRVFSVPKVELDMKQVYSFAPLVSENGVSLVAGSFSGALGIYQSGHWQRFEGADTGLPIQAMASSPIGPPSLWFGCEGGLLRYTPNGWRDFHSAPSFFKEKIRAIAEAPDGSMWIGSETHAAQIKGNVFTEFEYEPQHAVGPVFTILPLGDPKPVTPNAAKPNTVLLGTQYGEQVAYTPGKGFRIAQPARQAFDSVFKLLPARAGWMVARRSGVEFCSLSGCRSYGVAEGMRPGLQFAIVQGSDDRLWAGGENGLSVFTPTVGWRPFDAPGVDNVTTIQLSKSKQGESLWMGSDSAGVVRMTNADPKQMVRFDSGSRPALPHDVVNALELDASGNVYVFTSHGIARLSSDERGELHSRSFNSEDGLPDDETVFGASLIDSKGRVWAGTNGGLSVFDPAKESVFERPRRIVLEASLTSGDHRALQSGQVVDFSSASMTFDFVLLGYFRESETKYRTQLVGLDDEPRAWSADDKRELTKVPPGSYEMRVWAQSYRGDIVGPQTLSFNVSPPLWRTWWAYLLYVVVGLGSGIGVTQYRLRALRRRARELEKRVQERTLALDEKARELAVANNQLSGINHELSGKNRELEESQRNADRIFQALAQAMTGTVLDGKYELQEQVGEGGFGVVFRARNISDGSALAVKVFRPQQGNDSADALRRFQLEAKTAAKVDHPCAVKVLDSGVSSNDIAYIAMEFLDGHPLREELKRIGRIAPKRALLIVKQVADALAVAHAQGIIHRDIKPENIFLLRDAGNSSVGDRIKVLDFGVAKLAENASKSMLAANAFTMTGAVVGTPVYLSPERLDDRAYDGRSDMYSLGIVLYECLAGYPPFMSDNLFVLVSMHVTDAPAPLTDVPEFVNSVMISLLEKDPGKRPTAQALTELLGEDPSAR